MNNKRAAYTDVEISKLIKKKMDDEKINKINLYNLYSSKYENLTMEIIEYMLDGSIFYDELMLDIASEYLDISFDELTAIIEDNNEFNCRTKSEEDISDLYDMINILFGEMVNQIKLSGRNI